MKKLLLLTAAAALFIAVFSCNDKMDAPDPVLTGPVDMVYVEGGTFQMGATAEQGTTDPLDREKPVHNVTLSSYYIGKYVVTQAQWFAIMGTKPSYNTSGDSNLPVERVSWNMIVGTSGLYMDINGIRYFDDGFIFKLNAATGKQYRLPTEAEWEYAARGGNKSKGFKYSGSNTVGDVAWTIGSGSTKPVGTKAANELGIYDMSGNVYEWCWDWYGSYDNTVINDPVGASSGSSRVLRGGNWDDNASSVRSVHRGNYYPNGRSNGFGLRLSLP